jgi:hypothetical protein
MNIKTHDDVKKFKACVEMIKKFTQIPELQELKTKDKDKYKEQMREYFPVFSSSYESLFALIIENTNLMILDKMLEQLINIEMGNISKDDAEKRLGDLLADNFLYKK